MKRVVGIVIAVVGLAVFLIVNSRTAEAGISWCGGDLAPMATIAEERNSPNSQGELLDFPVPAQAVSVDKGGSNTHK